MYKCTRENKTRNRAARPSTTTFRRQHTGSPLVLQWTTSEYIRWFKTRGPWARGQTKNKIALSFDRVCFESCFVGFCLRSPVQCSVMKGKYFTTNVVQLVNKLVGLNWQLTVNSNWQNDRYLSDWQQRKYYTHPFSLIGKILSRNKFNNPVKTKRNMTIIVSNMAANNTHHPTYYKLTSPPSPN